MAVAAEDLCRSVIAVPPLCRAADGALSTVENGRLAAHLRAGGVSTFLWGGNANLYNMGVAEFARLLDMLEAIAAPGDWHIPSIGADYGKACDQVDLLKERAFPTAMLLPLRFPATQAGIAAGIARLADRLGRPLIVYVKDAGFIAAADLARLVRDGAACAVKYAVVRDDPMDDPELARLLDAGVPRARIVSGIGERPAADHLAGWGLAGFTSGSVCVAPGLSTAILAALKRGDRAEADRLRALFLPLEDLRDAHSPLRVLHAAVALAGIAATGPMSPFLSDIEDPATLAAIAAAAQALRAAGAQAKAAA